MESHPKQDVGIIMDLQYLGQSLPTVQAKIVERAIHEIVRLRRLRMEVQK